MAGVMNHFGWMTTESIVSLDAIGPNGRWRWSQNNFTDDIQAKLSADVTVLNKSKWRQCVPCVLFSRGYISFIMRKYIL